MKESLPSPELTSNDLAFSWLDAATRHYEEKAIVFRHSVDNTDGHKIKVWQAHSNNFEGMTKEVNGAVKDEKPLMMTPDMIAQIAEFEQIRRAAVQNGASSEEIQAIVEKQADYILSQ